MEEKGTIILEYIIVFFILIVLCSLLISITFTEFQMADETQNRKEARIISNQISEIINNVNINQNGYSTTYTLPDKINKESYIVKINKTGVYINSHYQLTRSNIIPKNALKNTNYILTPGNTYEFKNINQTIVITQK
ncbi:hypothetical protein OTK55_03255 [Methanosphaera sp. Vir-13MRS]|uniref:hypothetical protein n=1 Tax=Candidatus Methanosphaera massiliense TaxID=3017187 RepID=UPI0023809EE8|nr:hypothetical protein [Candidatus Methanosphaera massiliense]MDD6285720.1 hypothetical protein [Methanobacteriaceae archaeon]MDE4078036.1 hypothetical protein [Candidatus Methanosphaera massiliense]MDY2745009.1 hypothetical protein [Methanosphaera sp.]